jgi:hypothetical protein
MKTEFIQDAMAANNTSLQGYITTTRARIEEVFGDVTLEDQDMFEKVTTEWVIQFLDDDSTVATIYDWKRYEEGAPGMNEIYQWHIGGKSPLAVELVQKALA